MNAADRIPSKKFLAAVESHLGASIAAKTRERLLPDLEAFPDPGLKELRVHLCDFMLPGLALYRTLLDEGRSRDEALETVEAVLRVRCAPRRAEMERMGRMPFLYPILRLIIRGEMAKECPPEGWDLVWIENSRDAIRWDVHRCYYVDVFTKLGVPELVAPYCNTDDYVYDGASKAYSWERKLTLGRGDDRCDFCFAATGRAGSQD
ncbi:MAG: L-2-amino-thiazoline-4-carboxylic acid hydrolase [Coriobacteriia bacterium]|nr:L-2-amino-thiazoline-4-carboxylic acid hydrolase [Coriobacteriia bacterium]